MVNRKTYTATYGQGTLRVAQNSIVYRDSTTAISAWDSTGSLLANFSFSLTETKDLIAHLQQIVDENEALKPKEKTTPEKIEELPPGALFGFDDRQNAATWVRTKGGARFVGAGGRLDTVEIPPSAFESWGTELYVRFDPTA